MLPSFQPHLFQPHTRVWQGERRGGEQQKQRHLLGHESDRIACLLTVQLPRCWCRGRRDASPFPLATRPSTSGGGVAGWRGGGGRRCEGGARALPPPALPARAPVLPYAKAPTPLHSLAPAPERPRPRGFLRLQPRPPCLLLLLLPPRGAPRLLHPQLEVGIRPPWTATTSPVPLPAVLQSLIRSPFCRRLRRRRHRARATAAAASMPGLLSPATLQRRLRLCQGRLRLCRAAHCVSFVNPTTHPAVTMATVRVRAPPLVASLATWKGRLITDAPSMAKRISRCHSGLRKTLLKYGEKTLLPFY